MEKVMLETLRVLVVDDDTAFLNSVSQYFGRIFKEVYPASSSMEAIELLKSKVPNIVITDIAMPKMDGHALAKEIHRISPRTPVFFLSALDDSEQSRQLGDGFIKKPLMSREDIETPLAAIEKEMKQIIGKCLECIYLVELDAYNYVQCGLSGDLLPKVQMIHHRCISKPCPYAQIVSGAREEMQPVVALAST